MPPQEYMGPTGLKHRFALTNPQGVDVFISSNDTKVCRHGAPLASNPCSYGTHKRAPPLRRQATRKRCLISNASARGRQKAGQRNANET